MSGLARAACLAFLLTCAMPTDAGGAPDREPMKPGTRRENVIYGMYSGLALLLDVEQPTKPNGFAVLHIPGSGFQAPLGFDAVPLKDSALALETAHPFLAAGFTVVTINHRATPRFRYPAAVEDAQLATRFVRAHATEFGIDPRRLAALGTSSGGHLVELLATLGEGGGEPVRRPDCVVAAMASSDLLPIGRDGLAQGYVTSFIGHPPPYTDEDNAENRAFLEPYRQASPINHVSPASSRMLLLHGDRDDLIPIEQSARIFARLREAGVPAEFVTMTGVGHEFPGRYAEQAARWLSECMSSRWRDL